MTDNLHGPGNGARRGDRRLSPAEVRSVTFSRAPMLHPGYSEPEVDHFVQRAGAELTRLAAERDELRGRLDALQQQLDGAAAPLPSEQAVRLLSVAQQTADAYVAEAEDFGRQVASEARDRYEEQMHTAREKAGAVIQAAQEAASSITGSAARPADDGHADAEQLQHQVVYLQAFGEAVRHQLRSYLEALITDVETEWGRADPASVPLVPLHAAPAPRPPGTDRAVDRARAPAAGGDVQAMASAPD